MQVIHGVCVAYYIMANVIIQSYVAVRIPDYNMDVDAVSGAFMPLLSIADAW